MDSKLKVLAIFTAFTFVVLVFAVVFITNNKPETKADDTSIEESPALAEYKDDSYKDFLKDDTFFDEEPKTDTVLSSEDRLPYAYLAATSVYKDIRVSITNENNEPIKGQEFVVNVDGQGEYHDVDKDGVVIIPELNAGDYYVSLNSIMGYYVPKDPMRVNVKDNLEYKVIEDISLLVMTEDDIDEEQEDTSVNDALETADATEKSDIIKDGKTTFGIDVSKYQGDIDWSRVKADNVDFAIIRAGYRGSKTGAIVEDPCFRKNLEGARNAGIQVGVYFFTQAVNETEGVEEASAVISLLGDEALEYPIFIDTEGAGGLGRADGLDKDTRTKAVNAFLKTVEGAGYHGGVYASRNWFLNRLNASELEDYVIWDAEYTGSPKYTGKFDMWQYTSNGMISGINTRVDLDVSYITIE